MKRLVPSCVAFVLVVLVSVRAAGPQGPSANATAPPSVVAAQRAVVDKYCVSCHNERLKTANLTLDTLDLTRLGDHRAEAEKVVRKLRAGMMPPSGVPRPDPATRETLIDWLERELDRNALTSPHLPPPGLHRLNRAEYTNAIRDLLGLQIEATTFLPPDDSTHGFDNMAGALGMSPALMEAYISAAGRISRLVMGTESGTSQAEFNVPEGTYRIDLETQAGESLGKRPAQTQVNNSDLDSALDFEVTGSSARG